MSLRNARCNDKEESESFHMLPSGHHYCLKFISIASSSSQSVSEHDYTQNHTFLPTTHLQSLLMWLCLFAAIFRVIFKLNARNELLIEKQSCPTAHFISQTIWWKKTNILLDDVPYLSSTKFNFTHIHKK